MALDASGSDADSYVTLEEAEDYASEHFIGSGKTSWDDATEPEKEASLRQAAQYIDKMFRDRFPGIIKTNSQALEWPRTSAYDRSGRHISNVPDAIKNAAVELAKERIVAGDDLIPVESRGGKVKSVSVGPVSQTYMDDAPAGRTYRYAEILIKHVLLPGGSGSVKLNRT